MTQTDLRVLTARCAERRAALLDRLGDGLLLVRTAPETLRNGDVHHAWRPGSDLAWLTGFPEPEAVLCAWWDTSGRRPKLATVLFVRSRDKAREIWDGPRVGVAAARRRFGVDRAFPIAELWKRLPELLAPHARLFTTLGRDPEFDRRLFEVFGRLAFSGRRANAPAHPIIQDPTPALAELRCIKDDLEIAALRRAAEITAAGHVAAMRAAAPGMTEYQVQEILEGAFRRAGSPRNGYESIVASGRNACILHYIENQRRIRRGELLLIDAGAEHDLYTADITRTFPVGAPFSDAQAAVYDVVLKAQKAAIRQVRPGRPWDAVHKTAVRELTKGLIGLGVLRGSPAKRIEKGDFRQWYMHGTSHWLGMDVHDAGPYQDRDGKPVKFRPGMVLTVEPGLYFAADDRSVAKELRGIGVRIEDDVLVTDGAPEVLTAACPKERREMARA